MRHMMDLNPSPPRCGERKAELLCVNAPRWLHILGCNSCRMASGGGCDGLQVPVAIGGPGLPKGVHFRTDLKEPGLANVGSTIVNLLGFETPSNLVPSLLA